MKNGLAVLLFAVLAHPAWAANPGDVIINEIMQNPQATSDAFGEWFELYNTTELDINLDGWTIRDLGSDAHQIDNGGALTIPAHGFVVLGNNADQGSNGGVKVDYEYSNFFLGDGADSIILIDRSLNEIDRVEYDGGTLFPAPFGASMSFTGTLTNQNAGYQNDIGTNWITSISVIQFNSLGTPGELNDGQVLKGDRHILNDMRALSPPLTHSSLGLTDRAVAVVMNNTVTVDSLGIVVAIGQDTDLICNIREVTFDQGGNYTIGPIIATGSTPAIVDQLRFVDVPITFTFQEGHVYDIGFNVPGGWGDPSVHIIEFYNFDNSLLNFSQGYNVGAFGVLDGRGFGDLYSDATDLPHIRAAVKSECTDMRPPFGPAQLRSNIGDEDRGIGVQMTSTVRVASIGILADIVSFTDLNLTIRQLFNNATGTILATASAPITPIGPTFYDVPIDFTFQAGQQYQIGFNIQGGWGANSIHAIEFFDFDNSTLNTALGYDAGGFRVLDGFGGSLGYGSPDTPHLRVCAPAAGTDLGHPTALPGFVSALGPQDRGLAIDAHQTVTVQSLGIMLNPPAPFDLTATIRQVSGTTLGTILSRETMHILPGGPRFYDVLMRSTLFAGQRYDLSFNVKGGWGVAGAPSMEVYTFNNSGLNPGSGFDAGPFTVLDGRGGANGYANTQLPHARVALLTAGDDLQAPVAQSLTNNVGNDDRAIAVEMNQSIRVNAIGIYMIAGEATTLTVQVSDLNGTTLGALLASASIAIVPSAGAAFFDVPIDFTFEQLDQIGNPRRYDIAFNVTGGWGLPSVHTLELDNFNNSTLNTAFGYSVGPFLVLDGRGGGIGYNNTLMPRIRAGYATPLDLTPEAEVDFIANGTQNGDWIGGTVAGGATTSVGSSGLCMFAPALGDNIALWVSPERYVELVDNTLYRLRVYASTSQTAPDAIPLWNVVYDNFNSSGLGNTYGGLAWFLDVAGGANGIGRANGRTVFDVYAAPNAVITEQWRGVVDFGGSAFSRSADASNDMRIFFRVLDANALINTDADSGAICIEKLEVHAINLNSIEEQSIVYNPKINTATHFPETNAEASFGSTPTIDNAHGTVSYALFSPDDSSTLGPFDPTQPTQNAQLYPVLWEQDTLYRGRVKVRSDVNGGFGPEGSDPVDAIIVSFDTATNELGYFAFTTRGSQNNMFRAASPRLRFTTHDETQTYVAYFFSHNTTSSAVPDANRLRFMAGFFNTSDLFGSSGGDPFVVESLAIDKMKTPNYPN